MLAYDDTGSGPAVVLLHGIGSSRRRWDPVVPLLRDRYRCIAVDQPGHGDSLSDSYGTLSAAAQVHELVGHLGLTDVVLVGHSMGATTALLYAALYKARSVVAIDPGGLDLPDFADQLAPYVDELVGGDFEAAFRAWERSSFDLDDALIAGLSPRREVVLGYWEKLLSRGDAEALQPQFAAALAAITVPVLFWVGAPPPPRDAELVATLPQATIEVAPGGGHAPHLRDPHAFARALDSWQARIPSGG